jgi:hypothetical protein
MCNDHFVVFAKLVMSNEALEGKQVSYFHHRTL